LVRMPSSKLSIRKGRMLIVPGPLGEADADKRGVEKSRRSNPTLLT
jgi:hypothetical protein